MANEFSRNTQDATLSVTATIPATATTATTDDINLGTNSKGFFTENHELEIFIPALTNAQLGSGATLTALVQNGASANPTTTTGISRVITGAGAGSPATTFRVRLPSGTLQYVNVKFTTSSTGGAGTATAKLLT